MRRVSFLAMGFAAALAACSRHAPSSALAGDAGSSGVSAASAAAPVGAAGNGGDGAIFSAPIAGARVGGGDVIGGGLVVASRAIVAERIDGRGRPAWTRTLFPNATWSSDAELHAWPIAGGAAFVWRGPVSGKSAHLAVVVSAADGKLVGEPFAVGSLVCATDDGLAWGDDDASGSRVHLRTFHGGDASPKDEVGPPIQGDYSLVCGAGRAYAIVEGDESTPTTISAIGVGDAGAPNAPASRVTIPPLSLGRDEERDLFPWAEGDQLGLVRISNGGAVQPADVRGASISLLAADKLRVPPEDDVVAVDADARQVVLLTTHDESDACPDGRGGASVRALRVSRQGGPSTTLKVAPSACGADVGPFWSNVLGKSVVVGWAERAPQPEKKAAPVTGLAFRVLDEGTTTGRVVCAADAIADAECDDARCYALALVRPPGGDGMKPEALQILTYP
jgi:hypothetical protein